VIHTGPVPSPHPRRLLPALALVAVVGLGAAACSSEDGRQLPAPGPGQTTTSAPGPSSTAAASLDSSPAASGIFTLASPAFTPGGPIPVRFTCDGTDVSPPLTWTAPPPAAELALVVRDPDADGYVHWIVTGIDPVVQGFGEGGVPETAVELVNSGGTAGWSGPCPPAGSTHTYEITLYALPEPLGPEVSAPAADAVAMVEGAASARATLTGTYGR
jgi:Raf kinase inhibitor-like YbhB/YbcL family protein